MRLHDPLYGPFDVPAHLAELMLVPEVRRLSDIRLINTPSPTMAMLGEVRRYSHTLGVLFLASLLPQSSYSAAEWKAFGAAVLLHDVGTPPFAHLFEYHLREHMSGWDHERMARRLVLGLHAPENTAQQIYAGRSLAFDRVAEKHGVSRLLIDQVIEGRHPLATLLAGTLDIDNLDNVARMAWALGLPCNVAFATTIASHLTIDGRGRLVLPEFHRAAVQEWLRVRRAVYEVLNLEPTGIAFQAALSDAIGKAIREDLLGPDEWTLTDEPFLQKLRECRSAKDDFVKDYLSRPLESLYRIRLRGALHDFGFANRSEAKATIEASLRSQFESTRTLGHVIVDRGTFSRRLSFVDPNGSVWSEGEESLSVILYGFVRSSHPVPESDCNLAVERLLQVIPGGADSLIEGYVGGTQTACSVQRSFAFPIVRD
jgi:HD superfamily phosphohydrolase